jgi:hypothetical protein
MLLASLKTTPLVTAMLAAETVPLTEILVKACRFHALLVAL